MVNSVTHGDYERPSRIAAFMNDINSGFRLLNLKNDMLRKKFDSLKYDMKKVEEVVYDLSIRGLLKKEPAAKATAATTEAPVVQATTTSQTEPPPSLATTTSQTESKI